MGKKRYIISLAAIVLSLVFPLVSCSQTPDPNNSPESENPQQDVLPPADVADKDNVCPKINCLSTKIVYIGEAFYPMEDVTAFDETDGELTSFVSYTLPEGVSAENGVIRFSTAKDYTVIYSVSDKAGNQTTKSSLVRVVEAVIVDKMPPIISVSDLEVLAGDPIAYRLGATAYDDRDGETEVTYTLPSTALTVDDKTVAFTTAGTYTVGVSAKDKKGNETQDSFRITVKNNLYDTTEETDLAKSSNWVGGVKVSDSSSVRYGAGTSSLLWDEFVSDENGVLTDYASSIYLNLPETYTFETVKANTYLVFYAYCNVEPNLQGALCDGWSWSFKFPSLTIAPTSQKNWYKVVIPLSAMSVSTGAEGNTPTQFSRLTIQLGKMDGVECFALDGVRLFTNDTESSSANLFPENFTKMPYAYDFDVMSGSSLYSLKCTVPTSEVYMDAIITNCKLFFAAENDNFENVFTFDVKAGDGAPATARFCLQYTDSEGGTKYITYGHSIRLTQAFNSYVEYTTTPLSNGWYRVSVDMKKVQASLTTVDWTTATLTSVAIRFSAGTEEAYVWIDNVNWTTK